MRALALLCSLALGLLAPAVSRASAVVADSLVTSGGPHAMFGHYSPGGALALGVLSTVAPAAVAGVVVSGHGQDGAWVTAMAIGGTLGVWVGPAVGLMSGGRDDLAWNGLAVRGVALAAAGGGFAGAYTMMSHEGSDPTSRLLVGVGVLGAIVGGASAVYDLGVTPLAVDEARRAARVSVAPVLAPDRAGLALRF